MGYDHSSERAYLVWNSSKQFLRLLRRNVIAFSKAQLCARIDECLQRCFLSWSSGQCQIWSSPVSSKRQWFAVYSTLVEVPQKRRTGLPLFLLSFMQDLWRASETFMTNSTRVISFASWSCFAYHLYRSHELTVIMLRKMPEEMKEKS